MTEQNSNGDYNVEQTANARMGTTSAPVPENPTGDLEVKTPLDYLKDAFLKEIESAPIELEVPNRPGISIEFDTNISSEQIDVWRKQSTVTNRRQRRSGEGEMDQFKFMALVIIAKATIFSYSGQDVYLDPPANKRPLNFTERDALQSIVGSNAVTDVELVRDTYKNDAHVISVGSQIIEAAGYGDDVNEVVESPTQA